MNTQDLIKVLRKIVKEEVQKAVADEVNKSMVKLLAEVVNNRQPVANNEHLSDVVSSPKKVYSKNSKLNEVLNSTVSDLRRKDEMAGISPPKVSLSEMFDKISPEEPVVSAPRQEQHIDTSSKIGMLKSIVSKEPVGQQVSVLDSAAVSPIANVFKKDFRALMRKMDEQKEKGSGGGFFAGAIPFTPQVGGYDQH